MLTCAGWLIAWKRRITPANALGAQKHLREAVRLDPKFALGWALLSSVDAMAIAERLQPRWLSVKRRGKRPKQRSLFSPISARPLMAKGEYYYGYVKDYHAAVRYFEEARQFLPNSSRIPESLAYVARRRGQWDRSESFFNQAERLDPHNVSLLAPQALSCPPVVSPKRCGNSTRFSIYA